MSHRPYKFLIVPVVQQVDEDGNVIQEVSPEQPITVFGIEGLRQFAETFEQTLFASMNGKGQ